YYRFIDIVLMFIKRITNQHGCCLWVLLSCLVAWPAALHAANDPEPIRPTAIRTQPLSIPVAKPNNAGNTEFITVYLVVNKKSQIESACYWIPRIRDALMQTFYQYPMPWDHYAKLHLGVEDVRLYQTVQHALNNNGLVARVHATPSALRSVKGLPTFKDTPIAKCKVAKVEKDKKDDKKKH
ncbi:MAG: hypothetical protein RIB59_16730, partial [Rhodospirillales bacterium]